MFTVSHAHRAGLHARAMHDDQILVARVVSHAIAEKGVRVQLRNGVTLTGIVFEVTAFELPPVGAWGLCAYGASDERSGYWLCTVEKAISTLFPTELLTADPKANLEQQQSGEYEIHHGDGSLEHVWPDGTLMRVTTTKDGSVSNTTARARVTQRRHTRSSGPDNKGVRENWTPPERPPVDVHVKHSSGTTVTVTADGSINMRTARGHGFRLHDGTERGRDDTGTITNQGEMPNRTSSGVTLESELGFRFSLHDDPVQGTNRYAKLETPAGHVFTMTDAPASQVGVSVVTAAGSSMTMDDRATNRFVRIRTPLGFQLELNDTNKTGTMRSPAGHKVVVSEAPGSSLVELETAAGRNVELNDSTGQTTITDPARVQVFAPVVDVIGSVGVNFGSSNPANGVARNGDQVSVNIPALTVTGYCPGGFGGGALSGGVSTPATATGTIISASLTVKSV